MDMKRGKHLPLILWVVYFCYAICAALIFQKVLLPMIPSLHAAGGLLSEDSAYFDSVAWRLAEQIHLQGWGSWRLFPAMGAAGNVSILGALYALFGHDPTLLIPVNAALHALAGMVIFLLAREIAGKQAIGNYAGMIAATLFIIYPSALNWYGQIHKDGYAIAGNLLILLSWVKAVSGQADKRGWAGIMFTHLCGVVLIAIVRPYKLKLLLVATLIVLLVILVLMLLRRRQSARWKGAFAFFTLAAMMFMGGIKFISVVAPAPVAPESVAVQPAAEYADTESIVMESVKIGAAETESVERETYLADANNAAYAAVHARAASQGESYADWDGGGSWSWQNNPVIPDGVENYLELAARTRAGLIAAGLSMNAKSMIDQEVTPQSAGEMLAYAPRAFQVALLAPFPTTWLTNLSMTRLVATGEMLINYLCLPGLLLLLLYNRKPAALVALFFAGFFLTVNGVTLSNVGTLYRVRYAFELSMVMLGLIGWFTWLDRSGYLERVMRLLSPPEQPVVQFSATNEEKPQRKETLSNGMLVMGLTLLCFIGFFLRDILMAHSFGLGGELDNFFIALMIPMFVVTVLCMPLGSVFVPMYLELKEHRTMQALREWVVATSSWMTAGLLVVSVVLYFISPQILPFLYAGDARPDMGQLTFLLGWALPILLFSGMVILGNSVLNAHGRAVLSSTAQLVVPVVTIAALMLFGERYGVKVVMYGMVAGQVLNLLIVQFYVRQHEVTLIPKMHPGKMEDLSPLLKQYFPMAATAFFISVSGLVATFLAMSLPEGGVSAFNLGNKVVLFVTGLVGTAISSVVLPYFSSLVSKNHLVAARRELTLFLLFATFISVPVSAFLYVESGPIIQLLFEGKNFDNNSTQMVARVMQYAVVQLPFFVCNSLLLKYATATKHVISILVVAIIGLVVNVGASMLLMKHMGVAGIALGSTLAMIVSTVLLVLVLVRYWHIAWIDAFVMQMNWLLFVTLLVGVHFVSMPSIYATGMAYAALLAGYFYSLSDDNALKTREQN